MFALGDLAFGAKGGLTVRESASGSAARSAWACCRAAAGC